MKEYCTVILKRVQGILTMWEMLRSKFRRTIHTQSFCYNIDEEKEKN